MRLEAGAHEFYLPAQRIHIRRDQCFLPGIGIEIAIGAAVRAEGDMEVEGVRRCHGSELSQSSRQAGQQAGGTGERQPHGCLHSIGLCGEAHAQRDEFTSNAAHTPIPVYTVRTNAAFVTERGKTSSSRKSMGKQRMLIKKYRVCE